MLLLCSRTTLDEARRTSLAELAGRELRWPRIASTARRHEVASLLYRHLTAEVGVLVPPPVLAGLRATAEGIAQGNLRLAGSLLPLLRHFEEAGVSALAYKGPSFVSAIYGDLALRPYSDLDLIVRPRDMETLIPVLAEVGYSPEYRLGWAQEAAVLRVETDRSFYSADRSVHVEVHWRVAPASLCVRLTTEDLWETPSEVNFHGHRIGMLAPDPLILALAVHGLKHGWPSLRLVVDIAELVHATSDRDWQATLDYAAERGGLTALAIALFLARSMLGTLLPDEVSEWLDGEAEATRIAQGISERLLIRSPSAIEVRRIHLAALPGAAARMRYVAHVCLTPTQAERARWPLPEPFITLYGLARPFWLPVRYGIRRLSDRRGGGSAR